MSGRKDLGHFLLPAPNKSSGEAFDGQQGRVGMEYYDIDISKGDKRIAAERSIALTSPRDVWSKIAALANKFATSGAQIRVTDEAGEIVVLVGVTVARRDFSSRQLDHCQPSI